MFFYGLMRGAISILNIITWGIIIAMILLAFGVHLHAEDAKGVPVTRYWTLCDDKDAAIDLANHGKDGLDAVVPFYQYQEDLGICSTGDATLIRDEEVYSTPTNDGLHMLHVIKVHDLATPPHTAFWLELTDEMGT